MSVSGLPAAVPNALALVTNGHWEFGYDAGDPVFVASLASCSPPRGSREDHVNEDARIATAAVSSTPAACFPDGAHCECQRPALARQHGDRLALFRRRVDTWLAMRPMPVLKTLLDETQLSRRQLERNCKTIYGKPPKVLAREVRALRAAMAIAANPRPGYDLIEYGFYDQSHMIREVKHFTGMTPGQIKFAASVMPSRMVQRLFDLAVA